MKALIPAAGHGTRFAPFTKLVPKEMLPIGARPAIALIVDEAIEAGADEIVIITSPEKPLLKKWFELEPPKVKITWVDQLEQRGLGHAVLQAKDAILSPTSTQDPNSERDNRVLILLGDALVSGGNASAAMMKVSQSNGNASVIGCEQVPQERVSRYGIMKPKGDATRAEAVRPTQPKAFLSRDEENYHHFQLADIVEKPAIEEAPSNLAVAGRYLLDPEIFAYLTTQTPGKGGEIQLTDAIRRMLADKPVYGYIYPGHRHDIGNPAGYLKALEAMDGNG